MRYAAGRKEQTRAKILKAAGQVFRDQGYHSTGVDRVMEAVGLTAGGFYAHFDSKQTLLAEALTHSSIEIHDQKAARLGGLSGREWVEAFLSFYLDSWHLKDAAHGCPLVALVSEVSRTNDAVKARFEGLIRSLGEEIAANAIGDDPKDSFERAIAAVAICIGGLGIARSVRDEAFASQILESCRNQARDILVGGPSRNSGKGGSDLEPH